MRKIFFFLAACSINLAVAQKGITVESIYKQYAFSARGVQGFNGLKDGQHFTKLSNEGGLSITKHAISNYKAAGETVVNLSSIGLNKIDDYSWSPNEDKLLFTTETESIYRHSYTAKHFVFDLKTNQLDELDAKNPNQTLATFSPDGSKIAYIVANNIYVKDLASKAISQITTDGKFNHIINGTTDWVYEEEFGFTQGFCWSPDSKYIAFLKMDESKVKEFTMEYNVGELYPELYTFKYPKAGEDNSKVTTHIYHLDGKTTQQIELGKYEYIPRLAWSTVNNTLVLQTMNRHQNEVNYIKVEGAAAAWKATTFYSEKSATYIDIDDNLNFLKDGKSILRSSEKSGFNHIYKIDFSGNETQITKGDWDVITLHGIDVANAFIYYSAAKKGAIHQGIYKIDLKGKKDVALSSETGQNKATFTPGMNYFIKNYSNANTPPVYSLCNNAGKELSVMEDNKALKSRLEQFEVAKKEMVQFDLEGRTLNGYMIKPNNFDVSKKYPVYVHIYGGPGSNMVSDGWSGDMGWQQLLAQEGYIVVSVDPRGTMHRGRDFKHKTYLQLGKYELEDFVDVAKLLGTYTYVDKERIGIQGWSYGGFMSTLAMTKGAGTFKMGIAVAPVTNWKYYDNIYTERFMRTPAENESGYNDNSPLYFANQLEGNYFLIHGSGDDNVHYQNAMEMAKELVDANKKFDFFVYPNKNHGIYGGNTRLHLYNMLLDYVKRNL